jgi:hypothetical protein
MLLVAVSWVINAYSVCLQRMTRFSILVYADVPTSLA